MSFPWEFLVERWRFNHYQSHRNKRVCRNGSSHFKIEEKSKLILFSGLLKHYNTSHPDYQNTNLAMVKIQSVIRKMSIRLRESVSFFQVFRKIVFDNQIEFCRRILSNWLNCNVTLEDMTNCCTVNENFYVKVVCKNSPEKATNRECSFW